MSALRVSDLILINRVTQGYSGQFGTKVSTDRALRLE